MIPGTSTLSERVARKPSTVHRKESKNPQAKRKREVELQASQNYINWRRLKPDLFDPHLHHFQEAF